MPRVGNLSPEDRPVDGASSIGKPLLDPDPNPAIGLNCLAFAFIGFRAVGLKGIVVGRFSHWSQRNGWSRRAGKAPASGELR